MNFSQTNSTFDGNSSQIPGAQSPYDYVEEPQFSRIIRYVTYSVLFAFAICGNITVCIIPFRHKRMRTCTYFLITNLAVSDIGTMLCLPSILIMMEWNHGEWTMGAVMCKLVNPSLTMFYLVTTNTLVAIAFHRFVVVVFPFRSKLGKSKIALVILLTWLTAFFCVLPSFGARQLEALGVRNNETVYRCTEIFPGRTYEEQIYYQNIYTIFQYTINIFLPVVAIVIMYIVIAHKLRKMSQALGCGPAPKERRASEGSVSYFSVRSRSSRKMSIDETSARKRTELERKFLRMLAVVVIVFVVCYVPYTTFFLVVAYYQAPLQWRYLTIFYHYIYLLMWFPNALNPICYGALDDRYATIIKSLCCRRTTKKSHRYAKSASQVANSIPAYSRNIRSNQTLPPIIEKSRTQTGSQSSQDEGRAVGGKSKACCS
ncbi:RYamide receptor-like [Oculina patagonica]